MSGSERIPGRAKMMISLTHLIVPNSKRKGFWLEVVRLERLDRVAYVPKSLMLKLIGFLVNFRLGFRKVDGMRFFFLEKSAQKWLNKK